MSTKALFIVFLFGICHAIAAAEDSVEVGQKGAPEEFAITKGYAPEHVALHHEAGLMQVRTDRRSRTVYVNMSVGKSFVPEEVYDLMSRTGDTNSYQVFWRLQKGSIAVFFSPAQSTVYKVTWTGQDIVELVRLPPGELLDRVKVPEKSFCVPFGGDSHSTRLQGVFFRLNYLPPRGDKRAQAEFTTVDEERFAGAEGDAVAFGKKKHKILKIVPPDPKHKVIGWVALDPEPMKE